MFDEFEKLFRSAAMSERKEAVKGNCPSARDCESTDDLARWFKSLGVAAGVNARSRAVV